MISTHHTRDIERGFTLIELLVVISIISLLSSVILASLASARARAVVSTGQQFEASVYHGNGDKIVGQWDFNGDSGSTALDTSGYNNSALVWAGTSGTWSSNTPSGSGGSFDTSSGASYIIASNNSALNIATGGSVTMCAWVYSNTGSNGATQGILAKRGPGSWEYGMNFTNNNFQVYTAGTSNIASFNYNVPVKKWTYICGVISPSPTALYINGKSTASTGSNPGGGVISSTDSLIIGASLSGATNEPFIGVLDDVRIYAQALTAQAIQEHYFASLEKHNNLAVSDLK